MENIFTITGFQRYFENTTWLIAEKITRLLVNLVVIVWVARYLGPEQFGTISYAQALVGIFGGIAALGLDGIAIKKLVKDEGSRDLILGTSFIIKLTGSMVALFLIMFFAMTTSLEKNDATIITIIACTLLFQSLNVIDFYFQSKVLSRYIVIVNLLGQLIVSVIRIILILSNSPLITFAYVILFDAIILALGYIYVYKSKNLFFIKWKFKFATAAELLRLSWPLALSGIAISLYMKIDQVMIKEILDKTSVGHYVAALKLSEAWYIIPVVINSSFFPALINAKNRNQDEFYERLRLIYSFMLWGSVFISIPTTIFSDQIINLLYKEQFNLASSVLMIHIWVGVLVSLGVITSSLVIANNKQKNALIALSIGTISNIIINFFFIPLLGIIGAAFATIISQLVSGILVPIFFRIDPLYPKILIDSIWDFPRIIFFHLKKITITR